MAAQSLVTRQAILNFLFSINLCCCTESRRVKGQILPKDQATPSLTRDFWWVNDTGVTREVDRSLIQERVAVKPVLFLPKKRRALTAIKCQGTRFFLTTKNWEKRGKTILGLNITKDNKEIFLIVRKILVLE